MLRNIYQMYVCMYEYICTHIGTVDFLNSTSQNGKNLKIMQYEEKLKLGNCYLEK